MSFKDISQLELWLPLYLAEQNCLCNIGRSHYYEQFCGIILSLDQWFRRECHYKISYLEFWQPLCSVERNHFGRKLHEEQFCEIIFNLDQWFKRCCLKIFLIWSSGSLPVGWSGTICAALKKRASWRTFM